MKHDFWFVKSLLCIVHFQLLISAFGSNVLGNQLKILKGNGHATLNLGNRISSSTASTNRRSRRIVRGFEADIKSYPYAVFLYFDISRPSTCGSSLITLQAVLTSAHCTRELSLNKGSIHAYLGATRPLLSSVVRNVTWCRSHPRYDARTGKFDLSVAKFHREVPLKRGIRPIPICTKSIKIHTEMFTAGWGKQWPNVMPDFSTSRSLHSSKQRLALNSECMKSAEIKIPRAFICTLPINGLHYRGDLGNGLVILQPVLALVGVVSFTVNDVTVYINAMAHKTWIMDSLQ